MRRNTLNNMIMGNKRRDQVYQTLITDFVNLGVISREVGEGLLGYTIPTSLVLPKEVPTVKKEEPVVKKEESKVATTKATTKTTEE